MFSCITNVPWHHCTKVFAVVNIFLSLSLSVSSHKGYAVHLWDMWEVVQTQHVFESSLTAAFWRKALSLWGEIRAPSHWSPSISSHCVFALVARVHITPGRELKTVFTVKRGTFAYCCSSYRQSGFNVTLKWCVSSGAAAVWAAYSVFWAVTQVRIEQNIWIRGSNKEFKGFPHLSNQQSQCCSAEVFFFVILLWLSVVISSTWHVYREVVFGAVGRHLFWIICHSVCQHFLAYFGSAGIPVITISLSHSQEVDRLAVLLPFEPRSRPAAWVDGVQGTRVSGRSCSNEMLEVMLLHNLWLHVYCGSWRVLVCLSGP